MYLYTCIDLIVSNIDIELLYIISVSPARIDTMALVAFGILLIPLVLIIISSTLLYGMITLPVCSVLAVLSGRNSLIRILSDPNTLKGKKIATAAYVVGLTVLFISLFATIYFFADKYQ